MKKIILLMFGLVLSQLTTIAQKAISDITVFYDITVESKSTEPSMANMFNGATNTVYVKGNSHRTESVNSLGTSTTIYDSKTKNAAILKEYGAQKILVKLTPQNWTDMNKKYEGTTFTKSTETKSIAGFNCTKYIGKLSDGNEFTIYATNDIKTDNKDYNAQFKNAEGFVLQYEFIVKDMKVITTASRVLTSTIPLSKFDIPKSGFREMTYEESIKK